MSIGGNEKQGTSSGDLKKLISWSVESKAIYLLTGLSFVLYLLTKSTIFALLSAVFVVLLFIFESIANASKTGWKHEITELAVTLLVAGTIWYGASFLLHTSAPLDSVVSCSMLPNLQRGDMVILQGIQGASANVNVPEINLTRAEFDSNNWTNEQLLCAVCPGPNGSHICAATTRVTSNGIALVNESNQSGNLIKYNCGVCEQRFDNGTVSQVACTKSISIKDTTISPNTTNDIIVYTPQPGDLFKSEIIHRTLAKLNVENSTYYLVKGDNNAQLDLQFLNSPIPEKSVVGKVVFRIPYAGYLKLFLFGYLQTPSGCDSTLSS